MRRHSVTRDRANRLMVLVDVMNGMIMEGMMPSPFDQAQNTIEDLSSGPLGSLQPTSLQSELSTIAQVDEVNLQSRTNINYGETKCSLRSPSTLSEANSTSAMSQCPHVHNGWVENDITCPRYLSPPTLPPGFPRLQPRLIPLPSTKAKQDSAKKTSSFRTKPNSEHIDLTIDPHPGREPSYNAIYDRLEEKDLSPNMSFHSPSLPTSLGEGESDNAKKTTFIDSESGIEATVNREAESMSPCTITSGSVHDFSFSNSESSDVLSQRACITPSKDIIKKEIEQEVIENFSFVNSDLDPKHIDLTVDTCSAIKAEGEAIFFTGCQSSVLSIRSDDSIIDLCDDDTCDSSYKSQEKDSDLQSNHGAFIKYIEMPTFISSKDIEDSSWNNIREATDCDVTVEESSGDENLKCINSQSNTKLPSRIVLKGSCKNKFDTATIMIKELLVRTANQILLKHIDPLMEQNKHDMMETTLPQGAKKSGRLSREVILTEDMAIAAGGDQRLFGRLVGTKGRNIQRMQEKTGCMINANIKTYNVQICGKKREDIVDAYNMVMENVGKSVSTFDAEKSCVFPHDSDTCKQLLKRVVKISSELCAADGWERRLNGES
eukprot:6260211-Ditylum_brightwellii.AAC.1